MQLTQALTLVPERTREEKKKSYVTKKQLEFFLSSPSRDSKVMEFSLPKIIGYFNDKGKSDNEVIYTLRGVITEIDGKDDEDDDSLVDRLIDAIVERGIKGLGKELAKTIWNAFWDLSKWLVETVVKGAVRNMLRWLVFPVFEAVAGFLLTPVGLALAIAGGVAGGVYLIYKSFFSDSSKTPPPGTAEAQTSESAAYPSPFGDTFAYGPPIAVAPGAGVPATDLASLLQKGESNVADPYGVVNIPKGRGKAAMQPLEQMTVAQVMAAQAAGAFNAAGRYQIIDTTLADAVKKLHLTGNELFDKNLQDRIFNEYLTGPVKRPRLYAYLSGKSNDVYAAAADASQEWASVATPAGWPTRSGRISDGADAYYDNSRNNPAKAHITADQMIATLKLERAKRLGQSAVGTSVESQTVSVAPEAVLPATTQGKIKAVSNAQNRGSTLNQPQNDKTIIKTPDGKMVAANI